MNNILNMKVCDEMCIYLGQKFGLTYTSQEHVLPAALGCCTKLDKGVVSDEANKYFSPIERDVIEHSLIQIPRIIKGPGKRGKLSPKYAATSDVVPIKCSGRNGLGYMKGTEGYILSQFIISQENKIQFHWQANSNGNAQEEITKLKEQIASMGEKYVSVKMPQDDENVYIAYFKEKIHIGFYDILPEERVKEIKDMFTGSITARGEKVNYGQISATLPIEHNLRNLCIIAAKSAINTLAYLKGDQYILQTDEFDDIIRQIMSGSDEIFNSVSGIGFDGVEKIRQKFFLDNDQQFCILVEEMKQLKAYVFLYEHGFEVLLCNCLKSSSGILMDGIVCNWKERKDYKYLEYLTNIGVLSKG